MIFIKELKEKFEWDKLLLTATFGSINESALDILDFIGMSKHLDYMQISSSKMNVIETLIKMNLPPEKIIVKLPLYGKLKTTKIEHYRDISISEKSLTYNEMCDFMSSGEWIKSYDTSRELNIAKNNNWDVMREIEYKGSRATANLIHGALKENLAGAMISVDSDDNLGSCETELRSAFVDFRSSKEVSLSEGYNFPLLYAVNEAINISLDEISQETDINLEKLEENEKISFL